MSAGRTQKHQLPVASRQSPVAGRRSACKPRAAFTLVELMVVIGIIGLLVAIALPAFSAVRTRANITHTAGTLNAIGVGLETFRNDAQYGGGEYPPSYWLPRVSNPHGTATIPVGGANLLAWALAGADLQGTPGFRDIDGKMTLPGGGSTPDYAGGWASDTGNDPATNQLYAMDTTKGQPLHARGGPYVEMSKMEVPKRQNGAPATKQFVIDKLETKPELSSVCFLDTWHQPILYYRANLGNAKMAGYFNQMANPAPDNTPVVYNQQDNVLLTGSNEMSIVNPIDLGAGTEHPLRYDSKTSYEYKNPVMVGGASTLPRPTVTGKTRNFSLCLWDSTVTAGYKPQRQDSFVLISAGPDGLYGTPDDVSNIQINP